MGTLSLIFGIIFIISGLYFLFSGLILGAIIQNLLTILPGIALTAIGIALIYKYKADKREEKKEAKN